MVRRSFSAAASRGCGGVAGSPESEGVQSRATAMCGATAAARD